MNRGGLAQHGDSMFERNIGYLASQRREVKISTHRLSAPPHLEVVKGEGSQGEGRDYVGFIAGLDEGYLQLCLTDTQYMVQIDRMAIAVLEDTGRTIWGYTDGEYDENGDWVEPLDEESIQRLRIGIDHFSQKAKAVFEERRDRNRGKDVAASSP